MSIGTLNRNEKPSLWAEIAGLLLDRTIVLIGLVYIVTMAILVWHQAQLEDRLIESAAQEEARHYTAALTAFRTLYSREVVETVQLLDIVVTHDYDHDKHEGKAIPLPATLSMLIGNEVAKQKSGGQTALYSGYPFPWREAEWKQRDQFAKDAWQSLSQNPDEPFQRFEYREGRRWFRYATADLMRKSCVECHNKHPETPKGDWKENDVRGVLEVSLPLDIAVAQTESNLRESIGYTIAVGGLGLVTLIIVIGGLRRSSRELEQRVDERTAQLAGAERRFSTAVDSAAAAMILVDRDGVMVLVNAETERLFGYSHDELIGKKVEILVPERIRPDHPSLRDDFFASPQARKLGQGRDLVGLNKNGREISVEIGLSPIETNEGLFVLGTIVDLSERKQLEDELRSMNTSLVESNEELQESEGKYRDLFEKASDLIQSVAPDGSFEYVNPAWKKSLGYSDDEIANLSMFDIIHPDSQAHCQEMFQRIMAGEKLEHVEAKFVTKTGDVITVEGSSSCKFDGGKPVSSRGIFHDITNRKQAEEKLRQQDEELKNTNMELERFNRLTVGREMRMIELKKKINKLSKELGREAPYDVE